MPVFFANYLCVLLLRRSCAPRICRENLPKHYMPVKQNFVTIYCFRYIYLYYYLLYHLLIFLFSMFSSHNFFVFFFSISTDSISSLLLFSPDLLCTVSFPFLFPPKSLPSFLLSSFLPSQCSSSIYYSILSFLVVFPRGFLLFLSFPCCDLCCFFLSLLISPARDSFLLDCSVRFLHFAFSLLHAVTSLPILLPLLCVIFYNMFYNMLYILLYNMVFDMFLKHPL